MTRNEWKAYLAGQNLAPDCESFGDMQNELVAARDETVVAPLLDFGAIRASGDDAANFLHNLLSNDIQNLPLDGVRFAGLCTPKGRLLATFHVWRDGADLLLSVSTDIEEAILKKLSMYILRSKVKLATADIALLGVAGPRAESILQSVVGAVPKSMQAVAIAGGQVLGLSRNRYVLSLAYDAASALWPQLAVAARPIGAAAWRWLEISAGQPRVIAATQEAFVPQMVNMEVPEVGGVAFTKGCYPGQEIVARTQYLGKIKRRMYRGRLDEALPPGTDIFTPESGDQHCGTLATVAPSPAGGYECLVVVQSSGAAAGEIYAGRPGGPSRVSLLPMPYAID
ncbi:MAG TPA: folate-binding protein YgfZ [Rhodocyclaceae bacterium]|nr:folate-binding protein YgfZ [Rhodocyclaceae bacterium]